MHTCEEGIQERNERKYEEKVKKKKSDPCNRLFNDAKEQVQFFLSK